ncbi:MAG: MAPEG family protein [Hyphomonadaceae bacterium]|nr:MAPEG family protein [Hyphomonadaceae bacterium]
MWPQRPFWHPAAVLILWTMVMLTWIAVSRFPAIAKVPKEKLRTLPPVGARGQDLERVLPDHVNWKAHNYSHLVEQPTVFYAAIFILALVGSSNGVSLWLAWAYVVIRIAHSLWQATINTIPIRVLLFALSSICLIGLAVQCVWLTLF